ncbi:MAG: hypothetical protein ACRC9K_10900 [Afipia sp.]
MRMTRTLMLVAVAMATLFMGKAATAAPLAPVEITRLANAVQAEKAQYYAVPKYNQRRYDRPRYHRRYDRPRHHVRPRYYAPHRHHAPRRHYY